MRRKRIPSRTIPSGDWRITLHVLDASVQLLFGQRTLVLSREMRRAVTGDTLAWLQEWAEERGLDLGPDANLPLWDGTRPDYDLAVAGLLAGP
jgi:hypothetical protein